MQKIFNGQINQLRSPQELWHITSCQFVAKINSYHLLCYREYRTNIFNNTLFTNMQYETYQITPVSMQTICQPSFESTSKAVIRDIIIRMLQQKRYNVSRQFKTIDDIADEAESPITRKIEQISMKSSHTLKYMNEMQRQKTVKNMNQFQKGLAEFFDTKMDQIDVPLSDRKKMLQQFQQNLINRIPQLQQYQCLFNQNECLLKYEQFQQKITQIKQKILISLKSLEKQLSSLYSDNLNQIVSAMHANTQTILDNLIWIQKNYRLPDYPEYDYPNLKIQSQQPSLCREQMSTPYNVQVPSKAFDGLHPECWLTSSIIINYIQYLKQYHQYNQTHSGCYIMNESESFNLRDYNDFSERLEGKYLFRDYQRIGMVINKNNTHWYFIGIYTQTQQIYIYDSIAAGDDQYKVHIDNIRNYFRLECNQLNIPHKNFTVVKDKWNTVSQKNGSDCGVCTIINLTMFLANQTANKKIGYDYDLIGQLRIGLHFFICYLIYCKAKSCIMKHQYLEYCTRGLILSPNFRQMMHRSLI